MLMTLLMLSAIVGMIWFRKSKTSAVGDAKRVPAPAIPPLQSHKGGPVSQGSLVNETISVVLRRQIPVRFGEPPRSWLGGLPRMPAGAEWPTASTKKPEHGRTPLNFVAQIACEDLPPELWGGLGPRKGWLLLFLNAQDLDVMENPEAVQVLHVADLGPERKAPPGIKPVHDEILTGPDYGFVRSQAEVPSIWRRWPVDLVAIPNRADSDLAATLYEGADIAPERKRLGSTGERPFTWRGALYVVDSIIRALSDTRRAPTVPAYQRDNVAAPGWRQERLAAIEAKETEMHKWLAAADESVRQRFAPSHAADHELLAEMRGFLDDPADVLSRLDQSQAEHALWRKQRIERMEALRAWVLSQDLDSTLHSDNWKQLSAELTEDKGQYWTLGRSAASVAGPVLIKMSLLQLAGKGLEAALHEISADCYTSAETSRGLIPPTLVEQFVPVWRRLYDNRPHRMGGVPDLIQSSVEAGPTREVLLFQIASDEAMHWIWGDAGAIYVFLATDRLAAGDFRAITARFENH